jgi:G:T/U-mismatch repair DNA glycosylase
MRKPRHLGRTLSNMGASPVVKVENRELNDEERAAIAKRKEEQKARLARIAARAAGEEV